MGTWRRDRRTVLLIGSSIFAQWDRAAELFPLDEVVNRAVGGTTTQDWVALLPEVLARAVPAATPDLALFYCGSNDLNRGGWPGGIAANVARCRRMVHRAAPATRFAYFGIIKAPQKAGKWELIDSLNNRIYSGLRREDLYLESNQVLFRDGAPIPRFFVDDGLHLTAEAYERLTEYAAPLLDRWRNETI